VSERVAQVHDQGVEVLSEAAGGRLIAGVLEIVLI
jgi:biotin operon repressor